MAPGSRKKSLIFWSALSRLALLVCLMAVSQVAETKTASAHDERLNGELTGETTLPPPPPGASTEASSVRAERLLRLPTTRQHGRRMGNGTRTKKVRAEQDDDTCKYDWCGAGDKNPICVVYFTTYHRALTLRNEKCIEFQSKCVKHPGSIAWCHEGPCYEDSIKFCNPPD